MKYLFTRRVLKVAGFIALIGIFFLALNVWRSSALRSDSETKAKSEFHNRIRDGVGREVTFASPGDSAGAIQASVNSVDKFIYKRSGIKLSAATKERLADMEARSLDGAVRRITVTELSDAMSATALERLATLTDQEISHMDDCLRGFSDPGLPESFQRTRKRQIRLRANSGQAVNAEQFAAQVKAIKAQVGSSSGEVFSGMARKTIADAVKDKARVLGEAEPQRFAGIWDAANDHESAAGMTPLQAVLLTYSVASDDYLTDSETNLRKRMNGVHQGLERRFGQYPSDSGHSAFGVNGYLYSTPLDLVFDERTLNSLLSRIGERSAL